jgi:hypothetical protein
VTPPRRLVPTLSERLDWAILRAMSADPDKRPGSCREFVEDLTGHSTRRLPAVDSSTPLQELWYLVYRDDVGTTHTVKGTTSAIRKSLKDGLLGDASNVRASRAKAGPFEPLRGYAEFRDMVVTAAPLGLPGGPGAGTPGADTSATDPTKPQPPLTPAAGSPAPPVSPSAGPPAGLPHISLPAGGTENRQPPALGEVAKWLFFLFLLLASASVAYLFFP